MMKRFALLLVLLLTVVVLAGCKGPGTDGENGTQNPGSGQAGTTDSVSTDPTPTPEITPEPTVTPRQVAMAVETAAPGATPLLIDPIDRPTIPPIKFTYVNYESVNLGVSFNYPEGWIESMPLENTVQFLEPENQAHDGVQTQLVIQVTTAPTNQTEEHAKNELNRIVDAMRVEYPDISVGAIGENPMLGETGYYVNIRIPQADGSALRGRILVLAKNRVLYQVRYICPANYNSEYEKIYREVRNSIKEL